MAQGQEYPVFIRFILEQTGLEKAKEIETYLKGVERAAISTTRNFSSFSSAVLNLVNKQNLLLGVGLAVVGSIGAFAASTVSAAARAKELQNTTELLANRMGVSAVAMDKAAEALQKMGFTAKSSYTALAELVRGQVDLSKATQLGTAAQNLSVVSGISSAEALDRISYAVRSLYPWQLRGLGISQKVTDAYKNYADKVNKTVTELTAQEKRQIIVNEIIKEGEKFAGAYALATGNISGIMREFGNIITGIAEKLGVVFLPTLNVLGRAAFEAGMAIKQYLIDNAPKLEALGYQFGLLAYRAVGVAKAIVEGFIAAPSAIIAFVGTLIIAEGVYTLVTNSIAARTIIFSLLQTVLNAVSQAFLVLATTATLASNPIAALVGIITKIAGAVAVAVAGLAGGLIPAIIAVVVAIGLLYGAYKLAFLGMKTFTDKVTADIKETFKKTIDDLKIKIPEMPDIWKEALEGMSGKHKKELGKMQKDLEDENERYKDTLAKRKRDFERQLADMIWAHIDKKESLIKDLNKENEEYEKALKKRTSEYEKAMAEMKATHEKKLLGIEEDIKEEERDYAKSRTNILKEIEKEKEQGMWIEGYWNAQARSERLEEMNQRLADLDEEHVTKMEKIRASLSEENLEYEKNAAERMEEYRLETEERRTEHDAKIKDLQTRLDQENAILEKHRTDVLAIQNQERLDDITLLKQKHAEENAELLAEHNKRLADIKFRYKELGENAMSSLAAAIKSKLLDIENANKEVAEAGAVNFQHYTGEGAKSAGQSLIDKYIKGVGERISELIGKFGSIVKEALGGLPTAQLYKLIYGGGGGGGGGGAAWQHGGIIPGPVGTPVPILAHGGERVIPVTGADVYERPATTININITGSFNLDDPARVRELANLVNRTLGRQMELSRLGAG